MRTVEEQKKNLHAARLHPWKISNAIRYCCSLDDDDKEDMIHAVNATYADDSWEQYCALDTLVRDTLNDIIEETLLGKKRSEEQEKPAPPAFTQADLLTLSDVLITAISANNKASSLASSVTIRDAIREENKKLNHLHQKVCDMMED